MTSATPTRGRPRSTDRTEAILDTACELLHEVGYDNLRMQDVADRSGAGLATIYRRWATKPDLIAAAMCHMPELDEIHTGDPRADLVAYVAQMAHDIGRKGEYLAGLMAATREHAVMAEAVRTEIAGRARSTLRAYVREVVEVDEGVLDTLVDAIPGVMLLRAGLLNEPVDPDAYAAQILALVDALDRAALDRAALDQTIRD